MLASLHTRSSELQVLVAPVARAERAATRHCLTPTVHQSGPTEQRLAGCGHLFLEPASAVSAATGKLSQLCNLRAIYVTGMA